MTIRLVVAYLLECYDVAMFDILEQFCLIDRFIFNAVVHVVEWHSL